ncbi:hypothetical protein [Bacillus sp. OK048]|uniref:hypothetical protein n=1 Tax=Bacillus sp. OK048 TaxID=1882761 RepID=UPI00088D624F|nr:hypothetical protein [Bacillus sp. OK048]SDM64487.1 hypothetical protein SAMN05443253_104381 [Bacillus sp. OK048]
MQEKKVKKQLIMGCILFGISIISGSLQIVFSPFNFVRVVSLIVVIGSSLCVGAFIRELFILKKTINPNQ